MNLSMRFRGIKPSPELVEHLERQAGFALDRFEARIQWVRITLEDENGPRGGRDTRCRIQTNLHPAGHLVVEEHTDDPFRAVAGATQRLRHTLARRLDRFHGQRLRREPLAGFERPWRQLASAV